MRTHTIVLALVLAATHASAAVQPGSPPPVSPQMAADVQADLIGEPFRAPLPPTAIGDWARMSSLPDNVLSDPIAVPLGTVDLFLDIADVLGDYNQRQVALRINDGLDGIGAEVVPALASYAGLGHVDLVSSETLYSHTGDCNKYKLKLRNVYIELPFNANSVGGHFETGMKVKSDFDLPAAEAHAEIEWTIAAKSGAPWYCAFDPIPNMDIEADFTVDDLTGALDVTLETSGSAIQVDTIDDIDFALHGFTWDTNSWVLDSVLSLGFSLYDLFSSCSGQADCLTHAVNRYALSNDAFVDSMTGLVNDAIDAPLTISSGIGSDGFGLGFTVRLADVFTSTPYDTMTSKWDVDLSSTAATSSCAAALSAKAYRFEGLTGAASLTGDDMELEVPFHVVSKVAYFAGKQGAFCRSFSASVGGASVKLNLTPDGVVAVEGGDPGDPANTVKFTLPVAVEPTGSMVTGSATGTLVVKAELRLDGGSDLVLDNVTADVSALSGSFKLSLGPSIPAATLEPAFDTAAGHVASQLNGLEILNAVVHTGISGLSVSVGDVTTDGKAFVIGLDWN